MKISFFIGSMGGGGAERVISILANHYASKGWKVDIALLLKNEVGYKLDGRINIVDLTGRQASYLKNLPGWVMKIRKYLKTSKPDRVVSFVGRINVLVLMSSLGLKIPVVASERNDPKHDGRGKFMLSLCNKSYSFKHCTAIVHQTKYEESCFNSLLARKSYIIPNPIEVNVERTQENKYRIVTAGRLIEQKNHKMLVEAVSYLSKEFSKLCVDIYGDGALKDKLQQQIDDVCLSERVKLCGNVSDLHHRINTASIFVMTSDFEGLSNALLEAMMLGLCCITTDYPGVEEVIVDEKNGIIVPRGDARALGEAIKRVVKDDALRHTLRCNALETSKRYKKESVLKMWEQVIEQ